MTQKLIITIVLAFFLAFNVNAQLEKTLHQTFDITESNLVSLELVSDSVFIIPWAGNNILTETRVELYGASPSILRHFIDKENRYGIEADTTAGNYKLYSTDAERKPIRTRSGECPEIVHIKVFVPKDFELQPDKSLIRIN